MALLPQSPPSFTAQPVFDDAPASQEPAPNIMEAEIDQIAQEFAALGMNPHATVALWMGKPNRFTGVVITSAQEVLEYVRAEHNATATMQAAVAAVAREKPAAKGSGAVSGANAPADDGARARRAAHALKLAEANNAWRKAITDRAAAMVQWNQYVDAARAAYQTLKATRVS
jgi:hypothetical protein